MSVVIFCDHDDPDLIKLSRELGERGVKTALIKLGISSDQIDLSTVAGSVRVTQGDTVVTEQTLFTASVVFYRRWQLSPPRPAVRVPGLEPASQSFAEREWEAALEGTLAIAAHGVASGARWANSPTARWLSANKPYLLQVGAGVGFAVPRTAIGSYIPRDAFNDTTALVAKSISANELIAEGRYFSTSRVPDDLRVGLSDPRSCPSYIQEHLDAHRELRILYALDQIVVVEQAFVGSERPADLRYASPSEVTRVEIEPPPGLRGQLTALAQATGLDMFSADVIVTPSGGHWLVDVTPDGLWAPFEPTGRYLLEAVINAG